MFPYEEQKNKVIPPLATDYSYRIFFPNEEPRMLRYTSRGKSRGSSSGSKNRGFSSGSTNSNWKPSYRPTYFYPGMGFGYGLSSPYRRNICRTRACEKCCCDCEEINSDTNTTEITNKTDVTNATGITTMIAPTSSPTNTPTENFSYTYRENCCSSAVRGHEISLISALSVALLISFILGRWCIDGNKLISILHGHSGHWLWRTKRLILTVINKSKRLSSSFN